MIREAQRVIRSHESRLLFLGTTDEAMTAMPEGMVYLPMSCQSEGALQVFIEPVVPVIDLLVVGRSPMVQLLADLATTLGWQGRTADLPELTADDISKRTLVVIATQGHGDEEALELVASTRPAFIGLVASRKRGVALLEYLAERGVPQEVLDTVRTPVGLDLGHTSHREIAVAVLAELVQLRAAGAFTARPEAGAEPVAAAADQRDGRPGVRHDRGRRRIWLVRAHARARRNDLPLLLRRLPRPVRSRPNALPRRSGGLRRCWSATSSRWRSPSARSGSSSRTCPVSPHACQAPSSPTTSATRSTPAVVNLRMGPVKLAFAGKAHVAERDADAKRLVLDASGSDQRGRGNVEMKVTARLSEGRVAAPRSRSTRTCRSPARPPSTAAA